MTNGSGDEKKLYEKMPQSFDEGIYKMMSINNCVKIRVSLGSTSPILVKKL